MREKLPDRRPNAHAIARWDGHEFQVCVGFHVDPGWHQGSAGIPCETPLGRAAEVFASGPKTGSAMRAVIEDGCVLASHLAQRGMRFVEQARAVGTGSPLGAVLDAAAALEADARPERDPRRAPSDPGAWPFHAHRTQAEVMRDEGGDLPSDVEPVR